MVEPGSDLRIGATQVASTLVQQAHHQLADEGCSDIEIERLSRAFLAECTEGTVDDFIAWVRDRQALATVGAGLPVAER